MHGAFCDQPWPGNDAGDDPGLSRTVGSGDTRRTRLIPCACAMFCFVGLLSAIREFIVRYFAEEKKIEQNAKQNAENREFPVKTRKKTLIVNNDPSRADTMLPIRRARSASGCRRRSLGVETTSASCSRRGGTCWEIVAVARF